MSSAAVHRNQYTMYADAFRTWHEARLRRLREAYGWSSGPRAREPFVSTVLDARRESALLALVALAWGSLGQEEQLRAEIEVDAAALVLGGYAHYARPGEYTVTGLIDHHETHRPMVKYIAHGKENARPLRAWPGDPDGWNEPVTKDGLWAPRFRLTLVSPFDRAARSPFDIVDAGEPL